MKASEKDEQFYEQITNKMIRQAGVWCAHMETAIPGFPDVIATAQRAIFIEYKTGDVRDKLIAKYEPAQLRVHRDLHRAGAFMVTALFSPTHDDVYVYESGEMLDEAIGMLDVRFSDFMHKRFRTPSDFASAVVAYTKGDITREQFLLG